MSMSNYEVGPVVAVSDLDRSRKFYEEKLGLSPGGDDPEGLRYECGKGTGLFVYPSPEHAGKSTATLVGWVVDDVEKVVDELTSNGVTFEQYEGDLKTDEKGIFEADGFKAAWFRDPDGNTHAVNQA
jgi:catechol 2,3-dioxygenase-like lactoylglutathione lyase family enzyme